MLILLCLCTVLSLYEFVWNIEVLSMFKALHIDMVVVNIVNMLSMKVWLYGIW